MTNRLIYIVLLVAQVALGQSFEKGNEQYRAGKYAEAAASYEAVLAGKQESAEVYFNLGNAYYKMDKVAPAVFNYEKALLLDPNYKAAEVNLGFAQKMTIDNIKAVPEAGFSKLLNNFTGSYHYDTWAWAAVVFSAVFLLLFIGYYLAGATMLKRVFFVGMFVALLAMAISLLSAVFVRSAFAKERPAIVFAEVVSVKSEPLSSSQDAFVLHEGTKVFVTETLDNWSKIQLADDSEGWIEKDAIKELK
ncbi:MAG: tetratricopeptide repeat protein [Flavobacterium sp.]|nr:MAG: tetratricopeptide repeat protein [Flavobacterium sp.]